ncbi:MAG: cytochrome c3 family protein [Polyangiaceae bacterium]
MPFFSKSTGMACDDCHDKSDKKKSTPNVQIAAHMWDDYAVKLKSGAGPLFCDSCHDGRHDFLTRTDKESVKNLMNTSASKLTKKGGDAVSCQTCHTDDFEMKIFEKVWKIKK